MQRFRRPLTIYDSDSDQESTEENHELSHSVNNDSNIQSIDNSADTDEEVQVLTVKLNEAVIDLTSSSPLKRKENEYQEDSFVVADSDSDSASIDHYSPVGSDHDDAILTIDTNIPQPVITKTSDDIQIVSSIPSHLKEQLQQTPQKARRFKAVRDALVAKYLIEFKDTIFEAKLPNISVTWLNTLRKTAGKATCKHINGSAEYKIELASKVIDDEFRLRNTLAHEICHVAVWVNHGLKKKAHGIEFKHYASLFTEHYSALMYGEHMSINVTTRHSYEIEFKFQYKCENAGCLGLYQRHSKSLDVDRFRCGVCKTGRLVLYRNNQLVPLQGKENSETTIKMNAYAQFVKDNFASVRKSMTIEGTIAHAQVMSALSDKWKESKLK